MAVSLGEAISLQGRNTGAEQLGRAAFQSAEAEAARTAKKAMVGAQQAEKREEKISELFRINSKFHNLVIPEVTKLMDETVTKMQEIKSSGTPYASNKFTELYSNVAVKLGELSATSNQLYNFEKAVSYIDNNKKFYGANLPEFLEVYSKASRLSDLQAYVSSKPGLAADPYLVLTPQGIPQIHERDAIPFEKTLRTAIKSVPPSVLASQVRSIPNLFGKKEYQQTKMIPLTIQDAQEAYDKNKGLFPSGRPISAEDVVDDFLVDNPDVIEQISVRRNLGVMPQADGTYKLEDVLKVKQSLMQDMAVMISPKITTQVVGPPSTTTFNLSGESDALAPVKDESVALLQARSGNTVNNAATAPTDISTESFLFYPVQATLPTLMKTNNVTDAFGNSLTGNKPNIPINGLRIMPYKIVNGAKHIAHGKDDLASIKGVGVFVEFAGTGETYYAPWESGVVATSNLAAANKVKLASLQATIDKMNKEAKRITELMQQKTFTSRDEFKNFAFGELKF